MNRNMSAIDRIIRLLSAIGIVILIYFFHALSPAIGIILVVVSGSLAITGFFGFSPIYGLLDFKTSH